MELYLQMGYGMKGLAQDLIKSWGTGNVILSPVNMQQDKLAEFSKKVKSLGGDILFDPQMFYPKEGHSKLQQFYYWPIEGSSLSSESSVRTTAIELLKLNKELDSSMIILPGVEMDEKSFKYGISITADAARIISDKTDKKLLATVCLFSETVRNASAIEDLAENLKALPVSGFYLIAHPSNNDYLVSDPLWVMGFMKLVSCLKLANKKVIIGYSNHQGLLFALAKADGIASGTFMNTRSFVPTKFKSPKDDDIKHKSTWYYLPSAMNEYKAALLDVAMRRGFLDFFIPQGEYRNNYSSMMFSGAQPSSTNYNETNSFKHYLHCLRVQCGLISQSTYRSTYDAYEFMLSSAENQIRELRKFGLSGNNRDFNSALEANRIAMCANNEDYGLRLALDWNQ